MATTTTTPWRARWATLIPTIAPFAFYGIIAALVALHGKG